MSGACDVAVVGAGPAGMAAAAGLAGMGLEVVLIDEQPAPGGQIWRAIEANAATGTAGALGGEYVAGLAAVQAVRASGVRLALSTSVWQIEPEGRLFLRDDAGLAMLQARAILIAVGAQERPVPFPGWTLPGVMTVGAAQIALKTSRQIPDQPVWIAGKGPLALLYMVQLLAAGGRVAGHLDTAPRGQSGRGLAQLGRALGGMREIAAGLGWIARLRRAGVPVHRDIGAIAASGRERLEAVRFARRGAAERSVAAGLLLVHEGLVPNVHMTMALGCAHDWNAVQACFVPRLDAWGESSVGGVFVAGDGAGIGGARAAVARGDLAAIGIARRLGRLGEAAARQAAAPRRVALARALAVRPLLDALYPPPLAAAAIADDTIVCRCEEVTAGRIRAAARGGRGGPNHVKAETRAGMGACQGRQCGLSVTSLVAAETGQDPAATGFFRIRPPMRPVTLGELAGLAAREGAP